MIDKKVAMTIEEAYRIFGDLFTGRFYIREFEDVPELWYDKLLGLTVPAERDGYFGYFGYQKHKSHDLVIKYFENHIDEIEKYLSKTPGYRYLDVLIKAEKLYPELM